MQDTIDNNVRRYWWIFSLYFSISNHTTSDHITYDQTRTILDDVQSVWFNRSKLIEILCIFLPTSSFTVLTHRKGSEFRVCLSTHMFDSMNELSPLRP